MQPAAESRSRLQVPVVTFAPRQTGLRKNEDTLEEATVKRVCHNKEYAQSVSVYPRQSALCVDCGAKMLRNSPSSRWERQTRPESGKPGDVVPRWRTPAAIRGAPLGSSWCVGRKTWHDGEKFLKPELMRGDEMAAQLEQISNVEKDPSFTSLSSGFERASVESGRDGADEADSTQEHSREHTDWTSSSTLGMERTSYTLRESWSGNKSAERRPLSLAAVHAPSGGGKSAVLQNFADEQAGRFAPMASRPSSRCSVGAWSEHMRLRGLEMRQEHWQMTTQAALKMWAPLAAPDKARWGMSAGKVKRSQAISMLARPRSTPPSLEPITAEIHPATPPPSLAHLRRPNTSLGQETSTRDAGVHTAKVLHTFEYRTLDRWERGVQGEASEPPSPPAARGQVKIELTSKPKPQGRWGNPGLNARLSFERLGVVHDPVHAGKWSTAQRQQQNAFRTCRMPDEMHDQMNQVRTEEESETWSEGRKSLGAMGEESSVSLEQMSGSMGQLSAEMVDSGVLKTGSKSSSMPHRSGKPAHSKRKEDIVRKPSAAVDGWGAEMEEVKDKFSRITSTATLALRAHDSISRLDDVERGQLLARTDSGAEMEEETDKFSRKTSTATLALRAQDSMSRLDDVDRVHPLARMDSVGRRAEGVGWSDAKVDPVLLGIVASPMLLKKSPRGSKAAQRSPRSPRQMPVSESAEVSTVNEGLRREDSKMSVRTADSLRENSASDAGYEGGGEGEHDLPNDLTIGVFESDRNLKIALQSPTSKNVGESVVHGTESWVHDAVEAETSQSYSLGASVKSQVSSPRSCIPSLGDGCAPSTLLDTLTLELRAIEDTVAAEPDELDGETVNAEQPQTEMQKDNWEIPVRFLGENDSHPVHLVGSLEFQPAPDVETLFVSAVLGETRERKYDRKFGFSPTRYAREMKTTLETTTQMVNTAKNKYKREQAIRKDESVTLFPVAGAKNMLLFAQQNIRNPVLSRAWTYWVFFLRQRQRSHMLLGRLNKETTPPRLPAHIRKAKLAPVSHEVRHLQFVCEDGEVKRIGFEREDGEVKRIGFEREK